MNNHGKKTAKRKSASPAADPQMRRGKVGRLWWIVALSALALMAAALVWFCIQRKSPTDDASVHAAAASAVATNDSPLDSFLDGLTEPEKDSLQYYEVDEIPVF